MTNLIHIKASIAALAALGVIAGGAGQTLAKPTLKAHSSKADEFPKPQLKKNGTLKIRGTHADDRIALRLQAGNASVLQVDFGDDGTADFSVPAANVKKLRVKSEAGDDSIRIDEAGGAVNTNIPTKLDGGPGNDTIAGGSGAEDLRGGPGNDSIDGNRGADTARLGDDDDTFIWDPGDGSDVIEGEDGDDTMRFNGAPAGETVDISANGERVLFHREPVNITMDTHEVENIDFRALNGQDNVTVNDLTGTGVSNVNVDEANGGAPDGLTDSVTVNGTEASDAITVTGNPASGVLVSGLAASVTIQHTDAADELVVNGRGGNDSIAANGLAAGTMKPTLDGGADNDQIAGSQAADTLRGGDGSDAVDGNGGADTAALGSGDDLFVWDPGDGSDVIEGQDGTDRMRFNGAPAAETVDLTANGNRLRFHREPVNITMDTAGVERVDYNAQGGADVVTVNDLTGTDVKNVNVDNGVGDGATDRVIVNGTAGNDSIAVAGDASAVEVTGLAAVVGITRHEPSDRLEVNNTPAGADTVDHSGLSAGVITLSANGVLVP